MKNPHSEWILQIKSKSGFLGFMIRAFLWGTCKFTGLVKKKIQVITPFRIFEKYTPKVPDRSIDTSG